MYTFIHIPVSMSTSTHMEYGYVCVGVGVGVGLKIGLHVGARRCMHVYACRYMCTVCACDSLEGGHDVKVFALAGAARCNGSAIEHQRGPRLIISEM